MEDESPGEETVSASRETRRS